MKKCKQLEKLKKVEMSPQAESSLSLCPVGGVAILRGPTNPLFFCQLKRIKREPTKIFKILAKRKEEIQKKRFGFSVLVSCSCSYVSCFKILYFDIYTCRDISAIADMWSCATIFQYKSHSHYSNNPARNANISHFKLQLL